VCIVTEIPSHKKKWYDSKWISEAIAAGPPILGALYAAYAASKNPTLQAATPWLLVSAAWLAFGLLWKIGISRRDEQKQSPKGPLYAALCVVQSTVAGQAKLGTGNAEILRVTLHRVISPNNHPKQIEQVTPYVGGTGGAPGRKFPIQSGVAGRAITTGKPKILQFEQDLGNGERIDELTEWGYTREDAQGIVGRGRLSFMGVPIFGAGGQVIGVVYLDSTKENLFSSGNTDLILSACAGVASFITEQYR
jgi:hypothetical protein